MKRHLSLTIALFFALGMMAEAIPAGYYQDINGKKDAELKTALSQIVRGGERYNYGITTYHTSSNPPEWEVGDPKYGTWQALPRTDMHPDGIVWDMYSNCVRYYPNKLGDSGCSLNIEHCLPKSWWGGDENDAYKDLFNLNPSDQAANGQKNNYPPGHVTNGDKFDNGSFRMDSKNKSQYGWACFEPEEQYRGDFARAYFYMATAYEDLTWATTGTPFNAVNSMDNSSYLEFKPWLIEVLLDWHRADPVSNKEICRADRISDIQHNRNPFIDYPELVEYIWGDKKGTNVILSALACEFKEGVCPDPIIPTPDPNKYDTLINLSAITAALVNAIQGDIKGSANSGIRSNGNASITMGNGATDGVITFTGLNLTDPAVLACRASPYNSATSMQLDIYVDDAETPLQSIQVTVDKDTRNEVRYRITIPKGTKKIEMISVGGSTSKRACLQELYLLGAYTEPQAVDNVPFRQKAHKEIRDGRLVIVRDQTLYTPLGQVIQ